jgi:ribosomal-protein-alanine acetyltransferase
VATATVDALAELLELDGACFARPWTAAAWRAELEAGAVLVVRDAGGRVRGCVCATTVLDVVELRRIAVDPWARRSGCGRDLLAAVVDRARENQATRIELEVAAGNVAACGLYAAHGFRTVGRRRAYYTDPPDDALLMTLELASNDVRFGD